MVRPSCVEEEGPEAAAGVVKEGVPGGEPAEGVLKASLMSERSLDLGFMGVE